MKTNAVVKSVALAAVLGLGLPACSTDGGDKGTTDNGSQAPVESTQAAENTENIFEIEDAWVKATQDEEGHDAMTGAFGHLANTTGEDLTIVKLNSDAADLLEMHETVDGMMREIDGGFEVKAGETLVLEPGGDHFMLMEMAEDINPGDVITVTVETDNGDTQDIDFEAREFVGAQENYGNIDDEHGGHGDHGEHGHDMESEDSGDGDH